MKIGNGWVPILSFYCIFSSHGMLLLPEAIQYVNDRIYTYFLTPHMRISIYNNKRNAFRSDSHTVSVSDNGNKEFIARQYMYIPSREFTILSDLLAESWALCLWCLTHSRYCQEVLNRWWGRLGQGYGQFLHWFYTLVMPWCCIFIFFSGHQNFKPKSRHKRIG